MSDEEQNTPTPTEEPQEGNGEQSKVFDAEYVKKLRDEAAKYRTEAKANAEAAKKLADLEESQKSEQQKQAERLAEAEKRAVELERKARLAETAVQTGVPSDILAGPEDASEESLAEFVSKLEKWAETRNAPRAPKVDPNQGRANSPVALNGDGLEQALRSKLGI